MAKYELQDLLRIRDMRKDRAQKELFKAKKKLQEAEQFLQEQKDKEAKFIEKKPFFIEQIYKNMLQKVQFKKNYMDIVNLKLGKLDEHQMKLAIEVEKAQNKYEEAQKDVVTCQENLQKARVNLDKIEEHKKIWVEEQNALEELNQDKELEDFKPKET
ncbi:MAG: type III secretion system stalk subunit SctO [bacterium]